MRARIAPDPKEKIISSFKELISSGIAKPL